MRRVVLPALTLLCLVASAAANRVEAAPVTINPGSPGTSFFFFDSFCSTPSLCNSPIAGATPSLDIYFTEGRILVAAAVTTSLFIYQTGDLGTWPSTAFSVSGYLLDADGNALTDPISMPVMGESPTQLWPDNRPELVWPFSLPDGRNYLPATTNCSTYFVGSEHLRGDGATVIDPLVFRGVHFDITYPDNLSDKVIGTSLILSSYGTPYEQFPIYVSPEPIPEFVQPVPDPNSTLLLLGLGVVGLGAFRNRWQ